MGTTVNFHEEPNTWGSEVRNELVTDDELPLEFNPKLFAANGAPKRGLRTRRRIATSPSALGHDALPMK
jgi:hypothetical protein